MIENISEYRLAAKVAALMSMSEETIDKTDIPEAPEENWCGAKPAYHRPRK
jgi:hypothetical protein